ncbi:MAG: LysR family transcriptional regulator [Alphaproteobacteria bacterium]|nr:LysR family transcriptional regulator [Alphaproteobacteria bacterium]
MDRLSGMEVFARVAEAGSFTKAAGQLGISTSAASKHVIALENRLGARLLNRTTRRLSLTEVGASYYEWCTRIAQDVAEAESTVTQMHSEPRGRIKLNAPMSFGIRHLAPAMPEFLALYPELTLDMNLNDRFVDLIEEGYDVAVRIGELRDSSLVARRLAPARMIVCGAPAYFERHGVPKTPADLADHNCLGYSLLAVPGEWHFTGPGRAQTVRISGNFHVNNGDAMRAAALAGLGVVVQPTFIIGDDVARGALQRVLADFTPRESTIHAVFPHNRHLSAKVRVFVDFLVDLFAPEPYWDVAD